MIQFIVFFFNPGSRSRLVVQDGKRLEYRAGGHLSEMAFGLVFLSVGVFFLGLLLFRGLPKWFAQPPALRELPVALVVSLLILIVSGFFGLAGFYMLFGRQGTLIDKSAGTVEVWTSLPFRRWPSKHLLANYNAVRVFRTGGSWKSGPVYGVFLTVPPGPAATPADDLKVATVRVSLKLAEEVAGEIREFLGLPA